MAEQRIFKYVLPSWRVMTDKETLVAMLTRAGIPFGVHQSHGKEWIETALTIEQVDTDKGSVGFWFNDDGSLSNVEPVD